VRGRRRCPPIADGGACQPKEGLTLKITQEQFVLPAGTAKLKSAVLREHLCGSNPSFFAQGEFILPSSIVIGTKVESQKNKTSKTKSLESPLNKGKKLCLQVQNLEIMKT